MMQHRYVGDEHRGTRFRFQIIFNLCIYVIIFNT